MKFSKLGLLTLLISLFILNSCKNQDAIGLGVDDANQLHGSMVVDSNIVINTVLEDTVSTTGLAKTPLAYFNDPEFGTTESSIATALTLPGNTSYTLPTGVITIDSVRLILPYAEGFYGDSLTSKFKVDVHQLNERFLSNKTYYNNKQWNYNTDLLGSKTFTARPHDTISVYNIIKGAPDTLIKVAPQIRIPIDPAFPQYYLFGPASLRTSINAFQSAVMGLYINLDKAQTTGPGGNLLFTLDSARVSVYYRTNNGGTLDTAVVTMPVPAAGHAAQIKHVYSTKVQTALNSTATTNSLVYLQGLAGLRAKISFPDVKNMFDSLQNNVIINRAELVLTPAPGTTIPYAPAPKLTMYRFDLAKQRIRLQDASTSDPRGVNGPSFFGGYYNSATNEYHFLVTAYIQDLMLGKSVDYGTFIAPADPALTNLVNISPTASYPDRVIIQGNNSPYSIKLNVIYTKIK
ncbi:DUF4270 domain-containing protein [Mucilaginibacter segetis]|uniref:DUF4270 domain-containing protein n=1 Tax=Mucilaginibacter segetis TaxID=2793071 RepID=A0A934UNP7_9SPHI|nr:DUF4270 domain-containing protein [Mucilaginibacter segetis]MBK0380305.1 DUF4270 domain-containing protein [Mucilaginibacter segetis]